MVSKEKIVSLMDLTLLGDDDCEQDIIKLCSKAENKLGRVAAICVHKQFIELVKEKLFDEFEVATVINFPRGEANLQSVLAETKQALALGADEIDLVIDYKEYNVQGSSAKSCEIISEIKKVCGNKVLKIIIESGELKSKELILKATQDAIDNGADFVKTSTGKTKVGATTEAAETILQTIAKANRVVGFKASGGIRDYDQAVCYINLAEKIISKSYIDPKTFRLGVSGLLDNLLNTQKANNSY